MTYTVAQYRPPYPEKGTKYIAHPGDFNANRDMLPATMTRVMIVSDVKTARDAVRHARRAWARLETPQ